MQISKKKNIKESVIVKNTIKWDRENQLGEKNLFSKYKLFFSNNNLTKIKLLNFRRINRFGTYKHNKKNYFFMLAKYWRWKCRVEKYRRIVENYYVPFKFQHTQEYPKKYYRLSKWFNRAARWLTPMVHTRQLSWWQLYKTVTLEKRHPHRYKSYKRYNWLIRTMNNQWNYKFRAKNNYRLKQILYGTIVLPAFNNLKKKQFLHIRKNIFKIKPLGLQHSRPAMFLGKFERRIDILTYKLNFAPTIYLARNFVTSGLIYVSYLTFLKTINYKNILNKKQRFPLYTLWREKISKFLYCERKILNKKKMSQLSKWQWNMPTPVTFPSYLVKLKGIVHWSSKNITALFYKKFCNRHMPRYFIYNKSQTMAYFWRNLRLTDIQKQKAGNRISWKTMQFLL